jgi:hypothetical protein
MLLDGFRPKEISGGGFLRVTFSSVALLPQRTYFVQVGMRFKDAKTLVFPSSELAHFNVAGSASDYGFNAQVADEFLTYTGGIVGDYTWETSRGDVYKYVNPASGNKPVTQ